MSDEYLRREALKQIEEVGDETRGAIPDERERLSYQVRRRLSEEEQASVGDACDIRGTAEAEKRLIQARWMPGWLFDYARDEVQSA